MSTIFIVYIAYGILLIAGGVMGYVKAKSQMSLISGLVTGLLAIGVVLLRNDPKSALIAGTVLAFFVSVIFIMRYLKTRKAMPAVPLIVISGLVAIASIIALVRR